MAGADVRPCVFCQIAQSSTSTTLLYRDDRIVVFQDINPSAFRHYLSVPINHIATVNDLRRTTEDYELVKHMLKVGQNLLSQDAPQSTLHRFGFHAPHSIVLTISISIVWRYHSFPVGGGLSIRPWDLFLDSLRQKSFWRG